MRLSLLMVMVRASDKCQIYKVLQIDLLDIDTYPGACGRRIRKFKADGPYATAVGITPASQRCISSQTGVVSFRVCNLSREAVRVRQAPRHCESALAIELCLRPRAICIHYSTLNEHT